MKIIGHRGARGLAPENTIASFIKAIEHHVDEIECDVRVTKDGIPVMSHDPTLHLPSGKGPVIAHHTYTELLDVRHDLPTLEMAIRAVNHAVPMQLEIKPGVPTEPIITVLTKLFDDGWTADDFLFGSFDFKVLRKMRSAFPDVPVVVIEQWSVLRAGVNAYRLGTKRISMDHRFMWGGFVSAANRGGYQLYSYTLDNRKKARRWERRGLAGTITDFPNTYEVIDGRIAPQVKHRHTTR